MDIDEMVKQEYRQRRNRRIQQVLIILFLFLLVSPMFTFGYLMIQIVELGEKVDLFQVQLLTYIEHNSSKVIEVEPIASDLMSALSEAELSETNSIYWEIEQIENSITPEGKHVYLTFDDGPSYYTGRILDILEEYDVKATFFVVGNKPEQMDDLYVRIVEDGHELALHSYTHEYSQIYESPDALILDVELIQEKIKRLTGVESNIYRFPGGSSNGYIKSNVQEYISVIERLGLIYYDWNVSVVEPNVESVTSPQALADAVVKEILKNTQSIVLLHDDYYKPLTVQALPFIIEKLQKENIAILPITENTNPIKHIGSIINE